MKWLKRKELTVDQKIKRATVRKKSQLVGMYALGVLGGIGWSIAAYEGKTIVAGLLEGTKVTYVNTVQAKEMPKEWNTSKFTAYSVGDGFTPGTVMASGKTVYVGSVACPRDMAFGTVIEVKGYGTYTCEDRKSIKHPDSFDIYSETIAEAKQFGVKNLEWRVK
jgi:3D (Asp-Asp-Asp) domain-containing protein